MTYPGSTTCWVAELGFKALKWSACIHISYFMYYLPPSLTCTPHLPTKWLKISQGPRAISSLLAWVARLDFLHKKNYCNSCKPLPPGFVRFGPAILTATTPLRISSSPTWIIATAVTLGYYYAIKSGTNTHGTPLCARPVLSSDGMTVSWSLPSRTFQEIQGPETGHCKGTRKEQWWGDVQRPEEVLGEGRLFLPIGCMAFGFSPTIGTECSVCPLVKIL